MIHYLNKKDAVVKNGEVKVKTIGFIVNPIAGMGGPVGLKGTDGRDVLEKAMVLGAVPMAPARAEGFLSELMPIRGRVQLIAGAGKMGEDEARSQGFSFTVIGERKAETSSEDTREVARRAKKAGVDLLVFCGGDGTARDVLDVVDLELPVLGVPTGVKMQSGVFAVNPRAAARIAIKFLSEELPLREVEVMDVDEEAFRSGRLSANLHGYLLTPYEPLLIQASKMASPSTESELRNQTAIAIYIIEEMDPNVIYIIGPGTTTRTIADLLDQKKTLLGVDVFYNKRIVGQDVNEKQILEKIEGKAAKIIVTPIGGQGFIFGRGNQQISPSVIRKVGLHNIIVIATKQKLNGMKCLRVDTGDSTVDDELRGDIKAVVDYGEERLTKVK